MLLDCRCRLGESPVAYESGQLMFVDIDGCTIHSFDAVSNGHHRQVSTNGRMVGNVVPCASRSLPKADLLACLEVLLANPVETFQIWQRNSSLLMSNSRTACTYLCDQVLGKCETGNLYLLLYRTPLCQWISQAAIAKRTPSPKYQKHTWIPTVPFDSTTAKWTPTADFGQVQWL